MLSYGKLENLKPFYFSIIKDIVISETCKLVLLDFLCINNSQDLPPKPFAEELFYLRADKRMEDRKSRPESSWK